MLLCIGQFSLLIACEYSMSFFRFTLSSPVLSSSCWLAFSNQLQPLDDSWRYDFSVFSKRHTIVVNFELHLSGVGTAAIQLAKHVFGAGIVVTSASDAKIELCKSLGADRVINYRCGGGGNATSVDYEIMLTL